MPKDMLSITLRTCVSFFVTFMYKKPEHMMTLKYFIQVELKKRGASLIVLIDNLNCFY